MCAIYTDLVREGDHEEIPIGRSAAGVHRVPVEAEIGSVSRLAHARAGHGLVGADSVIPVQVVVIGRVSPGSGTQVPQLYDAVVPPSAHRLEVDLV